MLITFKEKDRVLAFLCNQEPEALISLSTHDALSRCEVDSQTLSFILTYFQRCGYVSNVNYRHSSSSFYVSVKIEAHDLYNRGGFYAVEELLLKNIEKLNLEIAKLEPSLTGRLEQFGTISSGIQAAAALIKGIIGG
jgi:hypothetical protein